MKKNDAGFKKKFINKAKENNSFLCIGLDSDITKIPKHLLKYEEPLFEFNKIIIDNTKNLVCAYKPNFAFYLANGYYGYNALLKTIQYIPEDIPVIFDAKFNDIGNTASMYAKYVFEELKSDAVTLNPYMGFDSIEPFVQYKNKAIFILCLTSNSGSKDFQYMIFDKKPLYEHILNKIYEWREKTNFEIGAVVGATHPEELKKLRDIVSDIIFLIPGVGAQQGDLKNVVLNSGLKNFSAIINVSRNIIYSSDEIDFEKKVYETALNYRNTINSYIT